MGAMKTAQLGRFGFVALAAVGVYSFVTAVKEGESRRICTPLCSLAPHYSGGDKLAPRFELPSLDGSTVRLEDFRGKTVIVNFWSKTCPPCLEEMPSLSELGELLKAHPNVVLLTITTDESAEDAKTTLGSVLKGPPNFLTLVDSESKVVREKFGTKLYPETWFIDPHGVIRARFDGPRDWSDPLILDFVDSLSRPLTCGVQFTNRVPGGGAQSICATVPIAPTSG
jgi:thiol-disulfide isomerase/thioredoxin